MSDVPATILDVPIGLDATGMRREFDSLKASATSRCRPTAMLARRLNAALAWQ